MHRLLHLLFFAAVLVGCASALSITINQGNGTEIPLGLTDTYYGSPIKMDIDNDQLTPMYVYADLAQELTSPEGYTIPSGTLCWKAHYMPPAQGTFLKGTGSDVVAYQVGTPDPIMQINASSIATNVEMGTCVKYIPSVQPTGRYATQIVFTIAP